MKDQTHLCYRCGEEAQLELYGYHLCEACKKRMGLFRDETVQRYIAEFAQRKAADPSRPSYAEKVRNHLDLLEKEYISKRIKLLHIQERLG